MDTEKDIMAEHRGQPLRESRLPVGFGDWLPARFNFKVLIEPSDGRWVAVAEDYNVVGMGDSPRAAAVDVVELVEAYLLAHFEDGVQYEEVLRPVTISPGMKIETKLGNVVAGLLRGAAERIPLPRERRLELPVQAEVCV